MKACLSRTESLAGGFRVARHWRRRSVAIVMDNSFECVLAWLCVERRRVHGRPDQSTVSRQFAALPAERFRSDGRRFATETIFTDSPKLPTGCPRYASYRERSRRGTVPPHIKLVRFDVCMQPGADVPLVTAFPKRVILYTPARPGRPRAWCIHKALACVGTL